MEKVSRKKGVVFGVIVAVALGLVTVGFGVLKSGIGKGFLSLAAEEAVEKSFGGVGLEITKKDGSILVVATLDGKPAGKAGVKARDKIVKINDEAVGDDPNLGDIVSKLRGKPGTEVTITVQRGDETKSFTMTREKIEVPPEFAVRVEGKPPRIEEWWPEEPSPFVEDLPWIWRGDRKVLEEYREALRRLQEARRKLWRSVPRGAPLWEWRFPFYTPLPEVEFPKLPREAEEFRMDMDVKETDESLTIKCDMPGMKKEDIDVSLKGNVLTIKGERKVDEETKDEKGRIVRKERRFGSFSRSFTLPGKVKAEDIKTSYQDGVLTVVVPKEKPTPEKKEEAIKIKIGTI